MHADHNFDVAVVGAGVFGAWTAYQLRREGVNVLLLDAYGPGNSRSSSGGESRIMRLGYGPNEIYTQLAKRSLYLWQEFFDRLPSARPNVRGTNELSTGLFYRTGVLWLAREHDPYCDATTSTLSHFGVQHERLDRDELCRRYPQLEFGSVAWEILEPEAGALMARHAVQTLVTLARTDGVTYLAEAIRPPPSAAKLKFITTVSGEEILADKFVFACGPWLPKLFPDVLTDLMHITRQEVYFFGVPAGEKRFDPEHMPIWIDFSDLVYAIPNLDNRGFKIAIDAHGPEFDPDSGERRVSDAGLEAVRAYIGQRVPMLTNAPVTETRVCQYENTSNGDFLIDRHPTLENVWLVGGGSGHGFKHGPAVGEYVVAMISGDGKPEPRFAIETKEKVQQRKIY